MKSMKEDIKQAIAQYIVESDGITCDDMERAQFAIDHATIEQLWALYKLTQQKAKFKILASVRQEYIAIQYGGCYCGIELDGYLHS